MSLFTINFVRVKLGPNLVINHENRQISMWYEPHLLRLLASELQSKCSSYCRILTNEKRLLVSRCSGIKLEVSLTQILGNR